jgi:hypothetical protein
VDLVWQLSRCPVTSRDSFYVIVAACGPAQLVASTTAGTVEIPRFESCRFQLGELGIGLRRCLAKTHSGRPRWSAFSLP